MNPLWTLLPPLAAIPFILGFGEARRNLREASIVVAGIALLLVNVAVYRAVMAGERVESAAFPFVLGPGESSFALQLSAEPMGVMFALLASFLWIVTTFYSVGYMRGHHETNQTRFYTCFALALAAVMMAAYSANLLTLFVAYEALTLSTFPLVTHAGNEASRKAGRVYLGILLASSIGLFLPALIWTEIAAGSLDFVPGGVLGDAGLSGSSLAILLAMFTFGIGKAAVMPLHRWLPAAMVAPTPVSALLHAVAVVKTGVFSLLKIVTYTFGIDTVAGSGAADVMLFAAGFTVIAASVVAFTKDNLKARLAYSTIGQLSYIVLAALLATTMSVTGGGGAHRHARLRQDHAVLLRRGDHRVRPQEPDQRARRARAAHALDDGGVLRRDPRHHRPAARGRALEQDADRRRLVRRRDDPLGDGAAVQHAPEHRLPAADLDARVPPPRSPASPPGRRSRARRPPGRAWPRSSSPRPARCSCSSTPRR